MQAAGRLQPQRQRRRADRAVRPGGFASPAARRGRRAAATRAAAWAAGGVAVFVLFLRISLTGAVDSDGANNALQAWDMLHGHVLLHGWLLGDVTFYAFELPLLAVAEAVLGLHNIAMHVAEALVYLIVAGCAAALAVTGARGAARVARAAVVVAVLAAPSVVGSDRWITLGFPDHTGSCVFLLAGCLLADRAPGRRFTAPLLCLILCAGQISDVTVRYVFVPAIALVCAYRAAAARKLLTGDAASLLAAAASVPLATGVRAVMRHFGAYLMVAPKTQPAPPAQWPHNAAVAWQVLRIVFGARAAPGAVPAGTAAVVFGSACMLAAAAGLVRVAWRWRSARLAEQVLAVAIVASLGVYAASTLVSLKSPMDIVAVLPAGGVLAARALVPAEITRRRAAVTAGSAAAVAALLPLSLVAAQPPAPSFAAPLAAWLQAHGLRYGLAGYWHGSSVTLDTGNQVQVRTVLVNGTEITPYAWETNLLWFDPARHYANFVVVQLGSNPDLGPEAGRIFGRPAAAHRVGDFMVLVYRKNLLKQVKPAALPPTS